MQEKREKFTIAIAGNPNSGKTTMFNSLTGARQKVGNYPGVTVARREGMISHGSVVINIVDLPGIYSLSAYSDEELVARDFLRQEKPHAVLVVIDATTLDRSLYLVTQLLELGMQVVIALNMMDELKRSGRTVDCDKLGQLLGVRVIPTVARIGRGKQELIDAVIETCREEPRPAAELSYGSELDGVIKEMTRQIQSVDFLSHRYQPRMVAIKYLEHDKEVISSGKACDPAFSDMLLEQVEKISEHTNLTLGQSPEALITDYRYGFIASVTNKGVVTVDPHIKRRNITEKIDRVLTNPVAGPIFMIAVLYAVFWFTINLGDTPTGWIGELFGWLGEQATALIPDGVLQSMVVSGIIDGVGSVMSFVPLIALLFLAVSFLEDTGYMARMSYMLDRIFRAFGLHGNSIVSFIVSGGIGGGCAVPGVMAARTLRSPKEKMATILTAPFMSCGAKMPVFTILSSAFFPTHVTEVLFIITITSWVFVFIAAKILRMTIISGRSTPFLMELPPYRIPTLRGIILHSWERVWQYIRKAGTIILGVSILLWASMTHPALPEGRIAKFDSERAQISSDHQLSDEQRNEKISEIDNRQAEAALTNSYAGKLGRAIEPVSQAAGFDWKVNIALVGGFAAKEVIISTLATAFSLGDVSPENPGKLSDRLVSSPDFNRLTAISLILFSMLYAPCFITVIAIAREAGVRWAIFSMIFNTAFAFVVSTAFYQIALRL